MVRRSSRTRRTVTRFGYNARYEPYPRRAGAKSIRTPGRRAVSEEPIIIEKAKETVKQLKVKQLDTLLEKNMKEHHTDEYEVEDLVLRRGQPFHLNVVFDRAYNSKTDTISLELLMGHRPSVGVGTRVEIETVTQKPDADDFGLQIVSANGPNVSLKVHVACDCLIGEYQLVVVTVTEGEDEYRFEHPDEVTIIFNPWCKKDDVYMENSDWREEYIMNENNLYFYGTEHRIGNSGWFQGQFRAVALECALYLLKKSQMSSRKRASPVYVARTLSALVNSQDDDGVLIGNWSGDYSDGVSPTSWTGSISILTEYMKTLQPVAYGQCWVFGGLLTTLCRTLGIPCRTITNFASAHDSDANLTLDYHFDEKDDALDDLNDDSIWNFHVWNDVWMARPDLPEGYGGWQALDSTPQETSGGIFQMGPCSHKAIKQGHVYLDYDTKFAFAEVNAETVYWTVPDNKRLPPTVIGTDPEGTGKKISTKAVGRYERHDITDDYKYREGSTLERIAVYSASRHVKKSKNFLKNMKQDVEFKVILPDETMVGTDFVVKVTSKNNSKESRTGSVTLTGSSVYYTGVKKARVISSRRTFSLKPGETETETFQLSARDYMSELTEYSGFTFFAMARVTQTKQAFSTQKDFVLDKPDLDLQAVGSVKLGQAFTLSISFTNPLDLPLKDCVFRVEGPGIDGYRADKFRHVAPHESVTYKLRLTPRRSGLRNLVASFSSDVLNGVKGQATLDILPA